MSSLSKAPREMPQISSFIICLINSSSRYLFAVSICVLTNNQALSTGSPCGGNEIFKNSLDYFDFYVLKLL
jgi:hypothetical protein